MTDRPTTEVRLSRFSDADGPRPECFTIVPTDTDPTPLRSGEVRYQVVAFGLNSGMATRIRGGTSPTDIKIGDVPKSEALVRVTDSDSALYPVGAQALYRWAPWRSAGRIGAEQLLPIDAADREFDWTAHLTVMGHVGFTAYVGLAPLGRVTAEDTVLVSAGAGGVGSCAVQIAKALGARVIACAGSDAKVALLRQLGADVALNYRTAPLEEQLRACGLPFTVYLDLVGGAPLHAAIETIEPYGRILICGRIADPSATGPDAGIPNYARMIYKELSMRGFASPQHPEDLPEFTSRMRGWLRAGQVRPVATVRNGMEQLPQAFADMLAGQNQGRMLVTLET